MIARIAVHDTSADDPSGDGVAYEDIVDTPSSPRPTGIERRNGVGEAGLDTGGWSDVLRLLIEVACKYDALFTTVLLGIRARRAPHAARQRLRSLARCGRPLRMEGGTEPQSRRLLLPIRASAQMHTDIPGVSKLSLADLRFRCPGRPAERAMNTTEARGDVSTMPTRL
jgi:hypothetical protein